MTPPDLAAHPPPEPQIHFTTTLTEFVQGKLPVVHYLLTNEGRAHYRAEYQALRASLTARRQPLPVPVAPQPAAPYKAPKAYPLGSRTAATSRARAAGVPVYGKNERKPRPHLIAFAGQSMTRQEWAEHLGLSVPGLAHRLRHLPLEEALQGSVRQRGGNWCVG
jgi:hypothetical protein